MAVDRGSVLKDYRPGRHRASHRRPPGPSPPQTDRQCTVYWTAYHDVRGGGGERGGGRAELTESGRRPSDAAPAVGPRSLGPGNEPQTTGSDPLPTDRTGAATQTRLRQTERRRSDDTSHWMSCGEGKRQTGYGATQLLIASCLYCKGN